MGNVDRRAAIPVWLTVARNATLCAPESAIDVYSEEGISP